MHVAAYEALLMDADVGFVGCVNVMWSCRQILRLRGNILSNFMPEGGGNLFPPKTLYLP
jgi:hypothetical protein